MESLQVWVPNEIHRNVIKMMEVCQGTIDSKYTKSYIVNRILRAGIDQLKEEFVIKPSFKRVVCDIDGNRFIQSEGYIQVTLADGRYGIGLTKQAAINNAHMQTRQIELEVKDTDG